MKTETTLRERAAAICEAYRQQATIKNRIGEFDRETESRLEELDKKIAGADDCDAGNVGEIQTLIILKEQRRLYSKQRELTRQKFLADINRQAAAVVANANFAEFFADALKAERASAYEAARPFMENDGRGAGIIQSFDSINALNLWASSLVRSQPHADIARRLEKFASGKCPLFRI